MDATHGQRAMEELEALVVDNRDLSQLESLLRPFNVFEAVGATWQELRHSSFLAFMADPTQPHGLGNRFLHSLLKAAVRQLPRERRPVSLLEVDLWNLSDAEVRREWLNIDILVISRQSDIAVIIENKLSTGEHDNQLARYWDTVTGDRLARNVIAVYLTPEGDEPSHEAYIPLSYRTVAEVIDELIPRAASSRSDAEISLVHYGQMLRRHILQDSEVVQLARRIYQKHRRALDLIFEHRPDRQSGFHDLLTSMLASDTDLVLDQSTKRYVRFIPRGWDAIIPILGSGDWTPSQRLLLFEFDNAPDRISIKLTIGPGDIALRSAILEHAYSRRPPFRPTMRALGKWWNTIWLRDFVSAAEYAGAGDLDGLVETRWKEFLEIDLPELDRCVLGWNLESLDDGSVTAT